jgi:hypothetical protein
LVKLLEDHKFEIVDLLCFYSALSQNITYNFKSTKIRRKIEKTHRIYIKQFIQERKVSLPEFLINDYKDDYRDYEFMNQIEELQHYYGLLENYVWLWNKYEFAFFEIKLAREIKARLSVKIS